ncbi:tyrosine-type recombinase/integrase [Thiorhodovibrio frisius]|uniref:tyrosine-type recombinase/integrase n=1 Tax=Thiorhodovibrio frisius TaxID=631362 RepID=UPI0036F39F1C
MSEGVDPSANRKSRQLAGADRATNSIEVIAREWFQRHSQNWVPNHANRIIRRLEKDFFPWIGNIPITDLKPPQILDVIRRIEDRGALETAHRALRNCGQVSRYAVATGRAERDPTCPALTTPALIRSRTSRVNRRRLSLRA